VPVAIAYAREGADVVINYLPEEQPDADEVIKLIEAEAHGQYRNRRR
jgi:NAD(P)-dependent dehydrogenase (short-subunit alcohol dehydrogenase family)